jgi:hypothetical protein
MGIAVRNENGVKIYIFEPDNQVIKLIRKNLFILK